MPKHDTCWRRPRHPPLGVHALRGAGRRLGRGPRRSDGAAGPGGLARHAHQEPFPARSTSTKATAATISPPGKKLPDEAVDYYVRILSNPEALSGSFGFYRAWDTTLVQNEQRKSRPLAMPVLAICGAESWGERAGTWMKRAADDVQTAVIPGAGHWVAEQAPKEMLAALSQFLARTATAAPSLSRSHGDQHRWASGRQLRI